MMIAFPRRALRLSQTAAIRRVPPGNDPTARETVATVACSGVYPASAEQVERAGLATVTRLMVVYCAASDEAKPDRKLATGDIEYRIRVVSYWPRSGDGRLMELLIEEES